MIDNMLRSYVDFWYKVNEDLENGQAFLEKVENKISDTGINRNLEVLSINQFLYSVYRSILAKQKSFEEQILPQVREHEKSIHSIRKYKICKNSETQEENAIDNILSSTL